MAEAQGTKPKSGWLNIAVDYGPLVVFFLVYRWFSPENSDDAIGSVLAVIKGTGAFMVAAVAALIVSKWKLGHVSPMLWLSTGLILFFGGLTIYTQEGYWIQLKPTVIYVGFALALLIGVWRGKPLLKVLLGAAFEGLSERGWRLLSRNWGLFFLLLAVVNELARYFFNEANGNFGTWVAIKTWGFLPLSIVFTLTQFPMMLREGLVVDSKEEVIADQPPTGE